MKNSWQIDLVKVDLMRVDLVAVDLMTPSRYLVIVHSFLTEAIEGVYAW